MKTCLGRRLISSRVEYFVFKGDRSETPLFLWLRYQGISERRLLCDSTGENLLLDNEEGSPVDLGDMGSCVIFDASSVCPIVAGCLGSTLSRAWILHSGERNGCSGVQMDHGNGQSLVVVNWGDELLIDSQYPWHPGDPDALWEREIR